MASGDSAVFSWLERRQRTAWKRDLKGMRALCSRLGDPQKSMRCVHVAGTNGKGTFCALLSAALRESGYPTGLYISPHLMDMRERIQVGGEPVSKAAFAAALRAVRKEEHEPLGFFEILTAAAFLHFRRAGVEAAVIETGLGGRLDATNILEDPVLCVVSSIGFDHIPQLGNTLEEIAREKAGIFKPGVPVLCGEAAPGSMRVLREHARVQGCPFRIARARLSPVSTDWSTGSQVLSDARRRSWTLALPGAKAAANASLALEAADILRARGLDLPSEALGRAFASIRWPGRFQILDVGAFLPEHRGRLLVLDGAHNPPAMEAFLQTWNASPYSLKRATFIVGMLSDKDHSVMLRRLAPSAKETILARPDSPRALEPEAAAAELVGGGGRVLGSARSAQEALRLWLKKGARIGVVCGSFYLVGGVLKSLRGRKS
ncbi:MAG: folylpolyglutamate synthase/dihydrofolate synthase family protein [Elusimicrobiota bacterium]|jgi:dihydrofolate synthase/folylpolyglutamate synthase